LRGRALWCITVIKGGGNARGWEEEAGGVYPGLRGVVMLGIETKSIVMYTRD